MQGNVIQRIRDSFDYVGQYHFADVPGRHEPGTGEINFRNVFRAIFDLNYDGYITAEYQPTDYTFRDLEAMKATGDFLGRGIIMRLTVPITLALLPVAAAEAQLNQLTPEEKKEGYTLLFNGKNLDGWDGDPVRWSVQDGVIVGAATGIPSK